MKKKDHVLATVGSRKYHLGGEAGAGARVPLNGPLTSGVRPRTGTRGLATLRALVHRDHVAESAKLIGTGSL